MATPPGGAPNAPTPTTERQVLEDSGRPAPVPAIAGLCPRPSGAGGWVQPVPEQGEDKHAIEPTVDRRDLRGRARARRRRRGGRRHPDGRRRRHVDRGQRSRWTSKRCEASLQSQRRGSTMQQQSTQASTAAPEPTERRHLSGEPATMGNSSTEARRLLAACSWAATAPGRTQRPKPTPHRPRPSSWSWTATPAVHRTARRIHGDLRPPSPPAWTALTDSSRRHARRPPTDTPTSPWQVLLLIRSAAATAPRGARRRGPAPAR